MHSSTDNKEDQQNFPLKIKVLPIAWLIFVVIFCSQPCSDLSIISKERCNL